MTKQEEVKIKADDWDEANKLYAQGYKPITIKDGEVTFRMNDD